MLRSAITGVINSIPASSLLIGAPRKKSSAAEGPFEKQIVSEKLSLTERLPGTIDKEVFFKFRGLYNRTEPRQYVVKLEGGRVWGNNGAIITADDQFVWDLSKEFGPAKFDPRKHSIFNRIKLKTPERFEGSLAVIASPGSGVYAHWLCDIIPRISLLKKTGVLDKVDKILINYERLDFQLETLDRMGISEDRLINCIQDLDFHLAAGILYVPSYPNEHGTVNPWVCQEVKKIFHQAGGLPQAKTFGSAEVSVPTGRTDLPKRLYISRAKANGRRLLNEDELFSFLQEEYGFIKIFTEDYDMAGKVELFGKAECIIGPHGGGMTNILFAEAGAKVIDLFPPGDFDTFFWSIANSNELEYYYFFGKGEMPTPENDFVRRNADIEVDMVAFKELLHLLNLEKKIK